MLQKITDIDEQREKAREEVTRVLAQHGAVRAKLSERQHLTFTEEEKARVGGDTRGARTTVSFVPGEEKNLLIVVVCLCPTERDRPDEGISGQPEVCFGSTEGGVESFSI